MRIKHIKIMSYGGLANMEISFQKSATLVYGKNEAGKSTLTSFIRGMLYGFSHTTYQSFQPLFSSNYGGQMILNDEKGGEWFIERVEQLGTKNGKNTLWIQYRDPLGTTSLRSQKDLESQLLHGLSAQLFREIFAITLHELQEIKTIQSDELSGFLFHAGMGLNQQLLQVERKLGIEADKLFRPKGRTQFIPQTIQNLENIEKHIHQGQLLADDFHRSQLDLKKRVEEIEQHEQQLRQLREEKNQWIKAYEQKQFWIEREAAWQEYSRIPELSHFPENAQAKFEALLSEQEHWEQTLLELEAYSENFRRQLAQLHFSQELLEKEPLFVQIFQRYDSVEALLEELRVLTYEKEAYQEQLKRIIEEISPEWDLDFLKNYTIGIQKMEEVRSSQEAFYQIHQRVALLQERKKEVDKENDHVLNHLENKKSSYQMRIHVTEPDLSCIAAQTKEEVKEIFSLVQDRWEFFRSEAARLQEKLALNEQEQRKFEKTRKKIVFIRRFSLIVNNLALIAIPAFNVWKVEYRWAIASFLTFAILDLLVLWTFRPAKNEDAPNLSRWEIEEPYLFSKVQFQAALQKLLVPLEQLEPGSYPAQLLDPNVEPEDWDALMKEMRNLIDRWFVLQEKNTDWQKEVSFQTQQVDFIQEKIDKIDEEMNELVAEELRLKAAWKEWLKEERFNSETTPSAVVEAFHRIENGTRLIEQVSRLDARILKIRELLTQFVETSQPLISEALESDHLFTKCEFVLAQLKILALNYEENRKAKLFYDQVHYQHEEALNQYKEAQLKLERIQRKKEQILELAHCQNEEDFYRTLAQLQRQNELQQKLYHLGVTLGAKENFLDEKLEYGTIGELLEANSQHELRAQVETLEVQIKKIEQQMKHSQEKKGEVQQSLKELKEQVEREEDKQKYQEVQASLKEQMDRYIVLSLAQQLFQKTRKIYEEEKQPAVLKQASRYFTDISKGKYIKVIAPLEEKKLIVVDQMGKNLDSSYLSRGTAEQLYFCMRLALCDEMQAYPHYPLILDDIFVNFDRGRLQETLRTLDPFIAQHQVIMFTCHEHIVAEAEQYISDIDVITI